MKLFTFLRKRGISRQECAKSIGVHKKSVDRYILGTRIPGATEMKEIISFTNAEVTADSFYNDVIRKAKRHQK